ncbi:DUF4157 domain-containing protein [Streptomyces violascens]|uniref:eCIS core domain-containing protein n=1 Tax=Streptomyces violascens TaxID=67381 RepID=UPI00367FA50F
MHDRHDNARMAAARNGRTPVSKPAEGGGAPPQGLLALQASAGNAAVVQLLRQAGHSSAQEQHQHAAGCGHQQTGQPAQAVQRSAVHEVLRAPGRPMDDATRTDMEARLGADFSGVRIHNDSAAKASAAEVGARAYTSGHHVVIGHGGNDKHTLAHELTHVIQQRQGPVAGTDTGAGLKVSDPADRFEREAEATARRVMSNPVAAQPDVQRAAVSRSSVAEPTVQRVQDRLTDAYWAQQAQGKKVVKAPTKASAGRKGEDILNDVGPKLIKELANKCSGKSEEELAAMGRLELFRTMEAWEAEDIEAWWAGDGDAPTKLNNMNQWVLDHESDGKASGEFNKAFGETKKTAVDPSNPKDGVLPVGAHLGDEVQALSYFKRPQEQVTMRFILRPGAHELLFHPDYVAVDGSGKGRTPESLRSIHGGMPQAKKGEGKLEGYVGIKQEDRGDFSVSLGTKWSRLLFQMFVERIERV